MRVDISRKDLRRDTFCSGGPGGQRQNHTQTGVRYTHLPTGIAAESRMHEKQGKNDGEALRLLLRKLRDHYLEAGRREAAAAYGAKDDASFGRQRRTYVLDGKNRRVEDHRTGVVSNDPAGVLDGEIDGFLTRGRTPCPTSSARV